jgi:hypothetical protein
VCINMGSAKPQQAELELEVEVREAHSVAMMRSMSILMQTASLWFKLCSDCTQKEGRDALWW